MAETAVMMLERVDIPVLAEGEGGKGGIGGGGGISKVGTKISSVETRG